MRFPVWITVIFALIGLVLVVAVSQFVVRPNLPLIMSASFDDDTITPNADGDGDVTTFRYELARNAFVTMTLVSDDGTKYVFRDHEPRIRQPYTVLFSGVVDGYTLPGEDIPGTIERRLVPNGTYTWHLLAENTEESQEASGTLTIADADSPLPVISTFTVAPDVFTPNQDGIDDRVQINVYLEKDADLRMFLVDQNGNELPISERQECRKPGEAGRHCFDYEGGVDLNAEPPPDGTYTLAVEAQDAVGQRIRRETQLTIMQGGKPLAEIVPQSVGVDVVFTTMPYDDKYFSDSKTKGEPVPPPDKPGDTSNNAITMQVGDLLVFKLTIENYSEVPIRTTGPEPGTVYQQSQTTAALGELDSSGAWRVGIQCETSLTSYPYRWAVGSKDTLEQVTNPATGETFYYLPAGARSVVWGAIRMTDIIQQQNPQQCYAGLIQEDVEVSLYNSVVGARDIELVDPEATPEPEATTEAQGN